MKFLVVSILLLSSIFLAQCGAEAGETDPLSPTDLTPGRGILGLEIGMSYDEIMATAGGNPIKNLYDQQHSEYTAFGFVPEQSLEFHLGFDYVVQFDEPTTDLPIFKVFFKDDKAVYLIFSVFSVDEDDAQISILGAQAFGDSDAAFKTLKEQPVKGPMSEYDGELFYLKTGVSYVSEEGIVQVVNIFEPLSEESQAAFLEALQLPITPVQ
jgi:hypothetical protein